MAKVIEIDTERLDQLQKLVGDADVTNWVIHDGVEYGIFQEFIHKASLVPAFERVTRDLPKAVAEVVENVAKGKRQVILNDVMAKAAFDIQAAWASDVNVDTGAYRNSIIAESE